MIAAVSSQGSRGLVLAFFLTLCYHGQLIPCAVVVGLERRPWGGMFNVCLQNDRLHANYYTPQPPPPLGAPNPSNPHLKTPPTSAAARARCWRAPAAPAATWPRPSQTAARAPAGSLGTQTAPAPTPRRSGARTPAVSPARTRCTAAARRPAPPGRRRRSRGCRGRGRASGLPSQGSARTRARRWRAAGRRRTGRARRAARTAARCPWRCGVGLGWGGLGWV